MERVNPALDDFMTDATPKRKRRPRAGLKRDQARRMAFRVLSLLAGLGANDRAKVLRYAERLNRA